MREGSRELGAHIAAVPMAQRRGVFVLAVDQTSIVKSLTERERILRLGRGDPVEVDCFYREHFDGVFGFVFHRLGGVRAEVEDVVSDTFLTALRQIRAFDGRSSLYTWLCGIAKNKVREKVRDRSKRRLRERQASGDPAVSAALQRIESTALPDAVLRAEETRGVVDAAMSQLPENYRTALLHKYVDGRSFVEIAEMSRRSPKAVESTVQRAKVAFARLVRVFAKARLGDERP